MKKKFLIAVSVLALIPNLAAADSFCSKTGQTTIAVTGAAGAVGSFAYAKRQYSIAKDAGDESYLRGSIANWNGDPRNLEGYDNWNDDHPGRRELLHKKFSNLTREQVGDLANRAGTRGYRGVVGGLLISLGALYEGAEIEPLVCESAPQAISSAIQKKAMTPVLDTGKESSPSVGGVGLAK